LTPQPLPDVRHGTLPYLLPNRVIHSCIGRIEPRTHRHGASHPYTAPRPSASQKKIQPVQRIDTLPQALAAKELRIDLQFRQKTIKHIS
jgi:hypothetical protein